MCAACLVSACVYGVCVRGLFSSLFCSVRNSDDMTAWRVLSWREVIADPTQSRVPVLLGYILPLVVFDALYPRRRLPNEAPGIVRLVGENILMLVVYDVRCLAAHISHSTHTHQA